MLIYLVNPLGHNPLAVCHVCYDAGWYYGKTAGLLGTYDNEPSNDFTTIDRGLAEKPEQLADGWTVGTKYVFCIFLFLPSRRTHSTT